jgi:PAS domain S-box-containing protein
LALYGWAYFADVKSISAALLVSDTAALAAAISLVFAVIAYFWVPKRFLFASAFSLFVLLCATVVLRIFNTGGLISPFIALWMLLCIFAGVFGGYGLLSLFVAVTGYLVLGVMNGTIPRESIVTVVLMGEIPLIASYIIWHTQSGEGDQGKDRAYRELATELSQVAGKSEVVINAIADGVIALDGQGVIQLINPAAQQIIGWGKQDALSLNYKSVLKLTDAKNAELTPANDPVSEVLATNKEVTTDDLILITNSGKKRLVSIVVSPVGQLGAGVIIVFRDITGEKEEERQQAEFISTASHEMRTPVASIEGYLGLALNPATAQIDDKARDYITKAHESAQHLGRLFQDLLDVSKAEDGRLSNNPKVVDVAAFVGDIVQGLTPKAEAKGLRMHYKPQPNGATDRGLERHLSPVFYANLDNDHLREVVANLVENAIKYTLTGDVTVDVTGDNEHVIVSIADSGIGIPKEDQAHLFQKFYRVDNSDTREIGGTGLGLYLCRRLTETMNGRIWVESEYKQGSTFFVEFPRLDHEEATHLIEAAAAQPVEAPTPVITPQYEQPLPPQAPTPTPVAPTQPPVAPAAPQPQAAAPQPAVQYTQAVAPQTQAAPVIRPSGGAPRPNTPLTSIEQNPSQYVTDRPSSVAIPPRNQN